MTIRTLFEASYAPYQTNWKSLASHRSNVARWERLSLNLPIESITTEVIEEYRLACVHAGLANDSVEAGIQTVVMMLNLAHRLRLIERVPWIGRRLRRRQEPRYVPPLEDLGKLYLAADTARWPRRTDRGQFWRDWLVTQYWCGARLGDMRRLTPGGVSETQIAFCASKTSKRHSVPMSPVVWRHLRPRCQRTTDVLFPLPKSPNFLHRTMKELSAAAGVKHITTHAIRRLSATQWQAARWGAGELIQGCALRSVAKLYIVPQLLQQAASLVQWPDAVLLPSERDERERDEQRLLEHFRHLDSTGRAVLLAAADRMSS